MDRDDLRRQVRSGAVLSYSRSGGPGGQNVNKRDTKVTARLVLSDLEDLPEDVRERMMHRLENRLTTDGALVLQADGERSQSRNREIVLERLERLVLDAVRPPPKTRRPSKPSRAARERRLQEKKHRGRIKSDRRSVGSDD